MVNKNYIHGRRLEYLAMNKLRSEGYTVYRTAGSHGEADCIAVNEKCVRLVQVKGTLLANLEHSKLSKLYDGEVKRFKELKVPPYCSKELWVKPYRSDWIILKI